MEKIIVYVDDAAHAQQQLAPMQAPDGQATTVAPMHWILVACAPRMTQRIGKWVSHSARESWRARWSEKLFAEIVPGLKSAGDLVTPVLAKGPLPKLTAQLHMEHGTCRVLDARRPKFGVDLPPVTANQPATLGARWTVPGAAIGMGAVLILAAE